MARTPIHPGEILSEELAELNIAAAELAREIKVPPNRITQIIAGKRSISADTALRLSQYFGTSAKFWHGLQDDFDIEKASKNKKAIISRIRKLRKKQHSIQ